MPSDLRGLLQGLSEDDTEDDEFVLNEGDNSDESGDSRTENSTGEESEEESVIEKRPTISSNERKCSICICHGRPLICCEMCRVCVHKDCYGGLGDNGTDAKQEFWLCDPCSVGNTSPRCELCPNTGRGPYKRTSNNRHVHVICAHFLIRPEWNNVNDLKRVELNTVPNNCFAAKACEYCTEIEFGSVGARMTCDSGSCRKTFHATCGRDLGLLEVAHQHNQDAFFAYCKDHIEKEERKQKVRIQLEVQIAERSAFDEVEHSEDVKKQIEARHERHKQEIEQEFKYYKSTNSKRPRPLTESPLFARIMRDRGDNRSDSEESLDLPTRVYPSISDSYKLYVDQRETKIAQLKIMLEKELQMSAYIQSIEQETLKTAKSLFARKHETKAAAESIEDCIKVTGVEIDPSSKLSCYLSRVIKNIEIQQDMKRENELVLESLMRKCIVCRESFRQFSMIECQNCKNTYHGECICPPIANLLFGNRSIVWTCDGCEQAGNTNKVGEQGVEIDSDKELNDSEIADIDDSVEGSSDSDGSQTTENSAADPSPELVLAVKGSKRRLSNSESCKRQKLGSESVVVSQSRTNGPVGPEISEDFEDVTASDGLTLESRIFKKKEADC